MLENRTIMITGGTGSFGNAFSEFLLEKADPKEIIILSRDEKKQYDMRLSFNEPRMKFIIGDVRDRETVFSHMRGVDLVFHSAALKQVPSCEFFPLEAVNTNIMGTANILDAAEFHGAEKVVVLSTDKAVYPINAMGMSKALMEKVMIAKSRLVKSSTVFCGVRYGNVMYSRGSVIPLFVSQIKGKKPLTVTNPFMTRFLLPLPTAVELVLLALKHGNSGDILVMKSRASTIQYLAEATINVFGGANEILNIGIRDGEKMHETLLTREELINSEEFDNYFRIKCERNLDYDDYFTRGHRDRFPAEGYTSANTEQLSVPEIERLLLSLSEIQQELS